MKKAAKAVSVVIPWRGGCEVRERLLGWSIDRWGRAGYRIVLSPQEKGDWCKALAVQAGVEDCPEGVVVVADADVWCEGVEIAVMAITCGVAAWAVPHLMLYRLDMEATVDVMSGTDPHERMTLDEKPYEARIGGGLVVAHRDTLIETPMDRRFLGWGQEDLAWGRALRCLQGDPWQGGENLFHLWHPPAERWTRARGSQESWSLYKRYNNAHHAGPEAMRKLLEEA